MTSHTSATDDTDAELIEQLKERALAAIARCGNRAVAAYARTAGKEYDATQNDISEIRNTTPAALVAAMRAPVGTQQLIRLSVHGKRRRVVINPIGKAAPDREREVWRQIVDFARTEAA
ncbi:hypothetical protein [Streptosporangium sp. NPDC049078]|uniref:hypothetical protein n=1 Tax=Streptosporangium sp. NPDC049078 TaxID=3155767 RepID=UPI0034344385